MPPHPRSDSSWPKREGSRVASQQLRSNNRAEALSLFSPLWFVRFDNSLEAPTITPTWAEGKALLRSNPSAVPGAKTEWGGTMPPSAIRDWHQSDKSSRPNSSPQHSSTFFSSARLFLLFFRCGLREGPALGLRLPFAQHVPEDRGQFAHHRDAGDGGAPSPLDPFEPLAQPGVLAHPFARPARQQPPRHPTARLGNVAQALGVFAAVAATGGQTPVVGQAVSAGETLDPADTARQRGGREVTPARHRGDPPRLFT